MAETEQTIETVAIPGGGRGVVLANGEVLNPVHASVKSLLRVSEGDLNTIIAWVRSERERAAGERAKRLAGFEERAAEIRRDAAAREAVYERMRAEEPWRFSSS